MNYFKSRINEKTKENAMYNNNNNNNNSHSKKHTLWGVYVIVTIIIFSRFLFWFNAKKTKTKNKSDRQRDDPAQSPQKVGRSTLLTWGKQYDEYTLHERHPWVKKVPSAFFKTTSGLAFFVKGGAQLYGKGRWWLLWVLCESLVSLHQKNFFSILPYIALSSVVHHSKKCRIGIPPAPCRKVGHPHDY